MNNAKMKKPFDNVMKIMKLVAKKMQKHGIAEVKDFPTPQELLKKGFHFDDIETAFRCLDLIGAQLPQITPKEMAGSPDGKNSVRQLHVSESIRLSPEAQKILWGLVNSGQISSMHFERVIEFLWQNDLRDVSPLKLELILNLSNPLPTGKQSDVTLSDRVPKAIQVN